MDGLRGHVELALLAVIAAGPAHGWDIISQARRRSGGVVELGDAGVYLVLRRLERDGLLRSEWAEVGGRRRRVYRITRQGRTELASKRADWARAVQGMWALLEGT